MLLAPEMDEEYERDCATQELEYYVYHSGHSLLSVIDLPPFGTSVTDADILALLELSGHFRIIQLGDGLVFSRWCRKGEAFSYRTD